MEEASAPAEAETTTTEPAEDEQRVPYERFQKANQRAKEAAQKTAQLEKSLTELRAQMEERDNAGLPELEKERKRADQLEKRAAEAEAKAEEAGMAILRSRRQSWVTAAAQAQNFADPSDASAFVNLDDIEDEKDAERAVKRLAGQKKHLLKAEEPVLPGRVLQNGQPSAASDANPKAGLGQELMNQFFSRR